MDLLLEESYFNSGCNVLAATDEAGRGPLAGPVVAACVILRPNFKIEGKLSEINDSKQVTEKKRLELFAVIMEEFSEVGVGICDHETIDRINILEATFLAMKKALSSLKARPDIVLVDGKFEIKNSSMRQKAIIDGDATIFSIAAASIIAKVTRDKLMKEYGEIFPEYGFSQHKGYGTKKHLDAIKKYGPCAIHRKSFKPIKDIFKL
jgi:ribonuclease HII